MSSISVGDLQNRWVGSAIFSICVLDNTSKDNGCIFECVPFTGELITFKLF